MTHLTMQPPVLTALYAGLLGLMSVVIAMAAGRLRGGPDGVLIGDGGNLELTTAMRRHANFVEVVPICLILIGLLELNGVSKGVIHGLGAVLVLARASHAYGFRSDGSLIAFRVAGALGSILVTVVASVWSITLAF